MVVSTAVNALDGEREIARLALARAHKEGPIVATLFEQLLGVETRQVRVQPPACMSDTVCYSMVKIRSKPLHSRATARSATILQNKQEHLSESMDYRVATLGQRKELETHFRLISIRA